MTDTAQITAEQAARKAEFNRLFESIPGRNKFRVKLVAEILGYKPNTVRVWRMKNQKQVRVISERMLALLRAELGRRLA